MGGWDPPPVPPDELEACRVIHRQLRTHDGLGLQGKSVLDYGCGRGNCLAEAARLGALELLAVDEDPDAVALAREACRTFRATFQGMYRTNDLPDGVVDVVWSHGVVEHLRPLDLAIYLREAARLSRRWVAVSAPNPANEPYLEWKRKLLREERWIFGYEEPLRSYATALRAAGLEVLYDDPCGVSEELSTMYGAGLGPERHDYWRARWRQGTRDGVNVLAIARKR